LIDLDWPLGRANGHSRKFHDDSPVTQGLVTPVIVDVCQSNWKGWHICPAGTGRLIRKSEGFCLENDIQSVKGTLLVIVDYFLAYRQKQ